MMYENSVHFNSITDDWGFCIDFVHQEINEKLNFCVEMFSILNWLKKMFCWWDEQYEMKCKQYESYESCKLKMFVNFGQMGNFDGIMRFSCWQIE